MDFLIQTPTGSTFPPFADPTIRRESPQYGPAWVADRYGTTHEERLAAVLSHEESTGVARISGGNPDQVAVAYARMKAEPVTSSGPA